MIAMYSLIVFCFLSNFALVLKEEGQVVYVCLGVILVHLEGAQGSRQLVELGDKRVVLLQVIVCSSLLELTLNFTYFNAAANVD
jgi:hypothetical protein